MPKWEANLAADVRGKRIGIPKEYRIDGVPAEIDAVWEQGVIEYKDLLKMIVCTQASSPSSEFTRET